VNERSANYSNTNPAKIRAKTAYEKWLEDQGRVLSPVMQQSFASAESCLSERYFKDKDSTDSNSLSGGSTATSPCDSFSKFVDSESLFSDDSCYSELFEEKRPPRTVSLGNIGNVLGKIKPDEDDRITPRASIKSKRDLKVWASERKRIRSTSCDGPPDIDIFDCE